MSTSIFYYTGTGNSLWVARSLAGQLGDATITPIPGWQPAEPPATGGSVGLVFPVHIWGVPPRVIAFLDHLKTIRPSYLFAVAVNAGQVANTLVQLKALLRRSGITLAAGFQATLPSNYIPWGGPGTREEITGRIAEARRTVASIAAAVAGKQSRPVEKGPLWQRIVFSFIYRMASPYTAKMDRQFWTDEKCNGCGVCATVCPSANITVAGGAPAWNHRCEQCFACLQWCPKEAIQYGRNTQKYPRYHHPEVHLKDMVRKQAAAEG